MTYITRPCNAIDNRTNSVSYYHTLSDVRASKKEKKVHSGPYINIGDFATENRGVV